MTEPENMTEHCVRVNRQRILLRHLIAQHHQQRKNGEQGSTLVVVLIVTLLLSVLLGALVTGTFNLTSVSARGDRDRTLSALLQGGVEDYLYRLNYPTPGNYLKYANVMQAGCISGLNSPTVDPDNPFMNGFATLPGNSSDNAGGKISYTIDSSQWCTVGKLTVSVTATTGVGTSQYAKKMNYIIKKESFTNFTYFTDYETLNPERYDPATFNVATMKNLCTRHFYEPTATGEPAPRPETALGQSPACSSISWMTNDYVEGNVHSNDAFTVCGRPKFTGRVTTGWGGDGTKHYINNTDPACVNTPEFTGNEKKEYCVKSNDPCQGALLTMPADTVNLKSIPGTCVYTGPTYFDLRNNSYGVISPYTTPTAGCGGGSSYVNVPLPAARLIYVQNVPAAQQASLTACTIPSGGSRAQNVLGYPRFDPTGTQQDITPYGCFDGDAFVQGTFTGSLTVVAENRLIIRQSIGKPIPSSVLGLIGNKGIEIYHPVTPDGKNMAGLPPVTGVAAALLSLNDSISVQNYDKGAHMGVLGVNGSFAQKWRGPLGTTDGLHGYYKQWKYDAILKDVSPPYFLTPVNGAFSVDQKIPQ